MKVFFKVASYVGVGLLGFAIGAYCEKEYLSDHADAKSDAAKSDE